MSNSAWRKSWPNDYEVGYKKPPKDRRWKPGQSGNAKGRPKGRKSMQHTLIDVLHKKQLVKEDGKPKTMTKQEAIINVLVNEAMKPDLRAIQVLFKLAQDSDVWNELDNKDRKMIIEFVEQDKDKKKN